MEKYTTEELELELISRYDLSNEKIDKESIKGLLKDLRNVNGFSEYLDKRMQNEVMNYFSAIDEKQRWIMKGHFAAFLDLKNSLKVMEDVKSKMKIGRYTK